MNTANTLVGLGLALALLSACAAQQADELQAAAAEAPVFTPEEIDAMSTDEKLAIYNENVHKEKDLLICSKRMVTGSHRRVTECRTIGEREQEKEAADDLLYDVMKHSSGVTRQ